LKVYICVIELQWEVGLQQQRRILFMQKTEVAA